MERNREYYGKKKGEGDWIRARREEEERRIVQDIVDYEIGSGYGLLNDDAENVASRRRWRL